MTIAITTIISLILSSSVSDPLASEHKYRDVVDCMASKAKRSDSEERSAEITRECTALKYPQTERKKYIACVETNTLAASQEVGLPFELSYRAASSKCASQLEFALNDMEMQVMKTERRAWTSAEKDRQRTYVVEQAKDRAAMKVVEAAKTN